MPFKTNVKNQVLVERNDLKIKLFLGESEKELTIDEAERLVTQLVTILIDIDMKRRYN